MKIEYGSTSPVTLADAGEPGLSNLKVNGQRLVQLEPLLRAPSKAVLPRSNHHTVVSFTASQLHASLQAAQEFIALHQGALADSGDLVITASDGTTKVKLAAACLASCEGSIIGVTTITNYVFEGTKFAVVEEEAP